MKKKTKQLILSIVITLVLLLTFTVTYAVFTYQQTGSNNQQLVLGDIYMHYNETNQLKMENAMPGGGLKTLTTGYLVNPIMATQTLLENADNELSACVDYLTSSGMPLATGTMVDFCKGTGTAQSGYTFQQNLDNGDWFPEEVIQEMVSRNIIIEENTYYTSLEVNPIMKVEETGTGILGKCESNFTSASFDEGTTATSFCQGTGTIIGGYTFQNWLDEYHNADDFMQIVGNQLLQDKIILPKIDLPYFEFTISGKNTYSKKDIWYEVVLNHGDAPENRNTRIEDEFLKFRLTEVNADNSETEIFSGKSYDTLENKRIHVETIPKNTMNEINKTYRLYMWIDENVVIGNVDEDYTTEEWNDVFASVKVNVSGKVKLAYEDKYDITDESCFTAEEIINYTHNNNMTSDELATCVTFVSGIFYSFDWYRETTAETFCQGTGELESGNNHYTFQEALDNRDYRLEGERLIYLEENNIITSELIGLSITDYDEKCESDVVIPKTINGNNVTTIVSRAFEGNQLTSVVIPNTVREIASSAFEDNQLTSVTFEEYSELNYIGDSAFFDNNITEVTIPNSVTYLDCSAFDYDVLINVSNSLSCTTPSPR